MKINEMLKVKHTAYRKRVRPTRAILFITHQLPKGLQVDEAVVLGKSSSSKEAVVDNKERDQMTNE